GVLRLSSSCPRWPERNSEPGYSETMQPRSQQHVRVTQSLPKQSKFGDAARSERLASWNEDDCPSIQPDFEGDLRDHGETVVANSGGQQIDPIDQLEGARRISHVPTEQKPGEETVRELVAPERCGDVHSILPPLEPGALDELGATPRLRQIFWNHLNWVGAVSGEQETIPAGRAREPVPH